MTHFYRYLRPLEYNFNAYRVQLDQAGGICFRCTATDGLDGTKVVTVAASICDQNDLFNQDVARKIADARFDAGHVYCVHAPSLATNVIALSLCALAERTIVADAEPQEIYLHLELHHLSNTITQIRNTHRIAWELDRLGRDVVEALHLKDYYEKLQNR